MTALQTYMRQKNTERREKAKRAGLCIQCVSEAAAPDRTKCTACLEIERQRRQSARLAINRNRLKIAA